MATKTFPAKCVVINGAHYLIMKEDDFVDFFSEVFKHADFNPGIVEKVKNQYFASKRIKKKRIRAKKQKQALLAMGEMLISKWEKMIEKDNKFAEGK